MPFNNESRVKMTPKTHSSTVTADAVTVDQNSDDRVLIAKQTSPRPVLVSQQSRGLPRDVGFLDLPRRARPRRMSGYLAGKRVFDLIVGSVLLIVAAPIVLVAAVSIRINTPGSPFFFQTRLGQGGKPFRIFKLRGMYIDARSRFPSLYDYSKKQDLEFCFHHEDDPRVTSAGRFIRKTSIDELPNLWNVVKGDMSLVGPRPEIPEVLALYGPYREEYLSVKPGITCWSKCTGRDRLTKRETIEFDLDYIRTRSFSVDFTILWRTFRGVVLRRDVF